MLEPCAVKVARTVLRGGDGSNAISLPGDWRNKLDLLRRSLGAFWDALVLQPQRLEDEMFQDLRFGLRMLLKNKSFTVVAVLSLMLGIGANTAIFQLLDAVRLRTLPVKAPRELAEVRPTDMSGTRGNKSAWYPAVTNPIWEQIRERQQAFSSITAWGTGGFNLAQGGEVRNARALWVSRDFFNVPGVQPMLGRVFTAADDQRGCGAPGVVISHGFWQREYGGAADIIGRKLMLSDHPFEIIGVTPANFFGLEVGKSFDLALPSRLAGRAFARAGRGRAVVHAQPEQVADGGYGVSARRDFDYPCRLWKAESAARTPPGFPA